MTALEVSCKRFFFFLFNILVDGGSVFFCWFAVFVTLASKLFRSLCLDGHAATFVGRFPGLSMLY